MSSRIAIIISFLILAFLVVIPAINTSGLFNSAFASNDAVTEADCRMCHCYNVPETHHLLVETGTYECLNCHQIKWDEVSKSYYTELIRDCVVCHSNVVGDTHHLVIEAKGYECLDCHQITWDEASQNYFVELNFTCITSSQSSNQPPVADAGPDQTVSAGQLVNFSGEGSYDPDGNIENYVWDFGDGSVGTGITISHTYDNPGIYTVTLSVTDDNGSVGTDTAVITVLEVTVNQPPVADAGPDQYTRKNSPVKFDGRASKDPDGKITNYTWNFGDGKSGSGSVVYHKYTKRGTYTVTLTVTDNKGATGTDIAIVTVKPGSKSNSVYADEVLWIDLNNIIDPDDTGIWVDITTKFIDAKSKSYFDLANQSNNSATVICMMSTIEPEILSKAVIRLQIRDLPKNSIQNIRIYAYNYDGKTIIPSSYLDYFINSKGFVDLDVTLLSHLMDGYDWMKFRITSTSGRIWISKGNFVLE
jgi:PKD repeat protein